MTRIKTWDSTDFVNQVHHVPFPIHYESLSLFFFFIINILRCFV